MFVAFFSYTFVCIQKCPVFSRARLHYDVIVTSYEECWYLFWYHWIEETHSYTYVPIRTAQGFVIENLEGVTDHGRIQGCKWGARTPGVCKTCKISLFLAIFDTPHPIANHVDPNPGYTPGGALTFLW
jgi:hypothetical protein